MRMGLEGWAVGLGFEIEPFSHNDRRAFRFAPHVVAFADQEAGASTGNLVRFTAFDIDNPNYTNLFEAALNKQASIKSSEE